MLKKNCEVKLLQFSVCNMPFALWINVAIFVYGLLGISTWPSNFSTKLVACQGETPFHLNFIQRYPSNYFKGSLPFLADVLWRFKNWFCEKRKPKSLEFLRSAAKKCPKLLMCTVYYIKQPIDPKVMPFRRLMASCEDVWHFHKP